MSCQEIQQNLNDFVDDELTEHARLVVEQHLATCSACRQELADLRSLVEAARGLEPEVAPSRDLWPAIESRLEIGRSVERNWWLQLAAAGIALAILSVPLSVWWTGRSIDDSRASIEHERPSQSVATQAQLARSEDGVLLARTDLVTAIERRRDVVEADTLLVLEENMNLLDRAIGEIRTALEEDPQNLRLRMLLAARYQQERKLLQKVSRV